MFLRRRTTNASSDEELVVLLRRGHQSALGVLWDRYAHLLFGVGMKYLKDTDRSKDVVVELFTALPEALIRHDVKSFRPWVHTVMRNRCLMLLRGDKPGSRVSDELLHGVEEEVQDEAVLHEHTLQRLEAAIAELSDGQRRCIELFHLQRHSYHQVAEITGLSLEQVRSNLQNGRRNLRLILERHADRNA